jgi:hypothetical protein
MTPSQEQIIAEADARRAKLKAVISPEAAAGIIKPSLPDVTFKMEVSITKQGEIKTNHFHPEMPHKNQTEESNCPMCRYIEGEFRALGRKLFSMAARSGLIE